MRSKFTWMLTLFMALVLQFSYAQEKTITGIVTDQDGLPLPGANVTVKGTSTGTQTDFDGYYSINVSVDKVLVYSFIGQKTVEKTVGSQNVLNITLEQDAQTLDEVVVLGYATATKETSGVASSTINSDLIENRPNANAIQSLSGQVAGLNIVSASGQPGAPPAVSIRGRGSINGNTDPLYVIDGIPSDANSFKSLNSNDISSVSVLKDAGATAIYGNRGANGVVIVKTKQGSYNSALKIDYTSTLSFSNLQGNDYDLMNSQEQLQLEKLVGNGRGSTLSDSEIRDARTTNWADYFFDTGLIQSHNLNLSGGSENLNQFTSLGYLNQDGILQESDLQRFNIRTNVNGKTDNEKFQYGLNLSANYSKSNEPDNIGGSGINRNYILGAYQSVPYISPDDYVNGAALLSPLSFVNTPLFLIDKLKTFTRLEEEILLLGSFNASYRIANDLTAGIVITGDLKDEIRTQAEGPESFNALLFAQGKDPSGVQFQQSTRQFSYDQLLSLNYLKSFGDHTIDATIYMEYFKAHYKTFGYRAEGLNPKTFYPGDGSAFIADNPDNDFYVDTPNANILEAGLLSYFTRIDYDYNKIFGVSGTLRRDGSYRFEGDNKWGTFYSVSGRVNLHSLDFMDGSIFDVLKVRGSYGTTGNQNISNNINLPGNYYDAPDLTRDLYATGIGYGASNSLFLSQIGNSTLTWETTTQSNVGVDFEMFRSRMRGSLDGYIKTTTDLYLQTPISSINSQTTLETNSGELENRGVEVSLTYDVFRNSKEGGFNMSINAVGSYNKQEIIDLPTENGEVISGGLTALREGGKLNEYYTYRYIGVNPENGNLLFLTADGEETENPNVDTDRVFLGKNFDPDFQGGFTLKMDYKGFFLSANFGYLIGVDRYDYDLSGFQDPTSIGQFRSSRDLLRAWTLDNTITDIPSLSASNYSLGSSSDRYLQSSDYLRLRFAQVGYSLPTSYLHGTGIRDLKFFISGENLFTITDWRGFDAETINTNNVTQSTLYPGARTVSFGVELGF